MLLSTKEADSKPFQPFTLSITFETEEELGAFSAAMNHTAVVDPIRQTLDLGAIRRAIETQIGRTPNYRNYQNKIHESIVNWSKR